MVVRTTSIAAPRWDSENGNRMATAIIGDGEGGTMQMEDVEPAKPLASDGPGDFDKWKECWSRIEIMDMHLWPLWEKAVHDIIQPLFKELQLIFLAYTRSISEDSAEDEARQNSMPARSNPGRNRSENRARILPGPMMRSSSSMTRLASRKARCRC